MKIVLVDIDQALAARLAPIAGEQEITLSFLAVTDELDDSIEKAADLVVLALRPGVDRFARLRERKGRSGVPVVVLVDRPDHVDSVVALELGADDYLPKDCEPRELMACIRAVLRSRRPLDSPAGRRRLEIGDLVLDLGSREAYVDGSKTDLTTSEFEILRILMDAVGRPVPRDELGSRLAKRHDTTLDRALDVHISHLRGKLGKRRHCIQTVRGKGYQFLAPSQLQSGVPGDGEEG